jgi:hypothetical protein
LLIGMLTLALLASGQEESPAVLVSRLGAGRYAERQAAADALRRLRAAALPALNDARKARDQEVRERSALLFEEIEAAAALDATQVRLDFRDRTVSEVAEAIRARSGMRLVAGDTLGFAGVLARGARWPERRISLESPQPVPFWIAVDQFSRASRVRRRYSPNELSGPANHGLALFPGSANPPHSDHGSIRIELLRIRYERDLSLAPGLESRWGRSAGFATENTPGQALGRASNSYAEILISVEPRLRIIGDVSLESLEVVGEGGQSLLKERASDDPAQQAILLQANPQLDPKLHPELRFGTGRRQSSTTQYRRIPLSDVEPAFGGVARLSGRAVVAVMARQPDPLVIGLAGAQGKTFEKDGMRLVIHDVAGADGGSVIVNLTLVDDGPGETLKIQGPGVRPVTVNGPLDLLDQQLQFLDDDDTVLLWNFTASHALGTRGRMSVQLRRWDAGRIESSKLRVRVHKLFGAGSEVPFSFEDIPLP